MLLDEPLDATRVESSRTEPSRAEKAHPLSRTHKGGVVTPPYVSEQGRRPLGRLASRLKLDPNSKEFSPYAVLDSVVRVKVVHSSCCRSLYRRRLDAVPDDHERNGIPSRNLRRCDHYVETCGTMNKDMSFVRRQPRRPRGPPLDEWGVVGGEGPSSRNLESLERSPPHKPPWQRYRQSRKPPIQFLRLKESRC